MIGTKSRISFIQRMPKKPKKFGLKIWALCESLTGYCLWFQIYTGKEAGKAEKELCARVVLDLMEKYLGRNYHVYFDNFYTSYDLVHKFLLKKTWSCGAIRVNWGWFSPDFIYKNADIGSSAFLKTDDGILAVHWKDKWDVFVVSAIHGNSEVRVQRHAQELTKPSTIWEYNKYMGGVDKCDQYLSYYTVSRRSMKLWKKVFFWLLELCITNSMCIYFRKNPDFVKKWNSHKKYEEALVHMLV